MDLAAGLPAIGGFRDFAMVGTLASYADKLIDRILSPLSQADIAAWRNECQHLG
jgi:hypothetical protein